MSLTPTPRVPYVPRPRSFLLAGLVALAVAAWAGAPAHAGDPGAWTTILRANLYNDLLADSSYVWATTGEAGLLRFDRAGLGYVSITRQPGGLASNALTALARDRSRRLWVGTQGAGLSYLSADRTRWNLLNQFDGLPSDSVNALTAQGDTLWIGTSAGVALWDGHRVLGAIPSGGGGSPFASNNITGVVVLGDSVLLATSSGVYLGYYSERLTRWDDVTGALPTRNVERLVSDGHTAFAFSSDAAWLAPWSLAAGQWVVRGGIPGVRTIDADAGAVFMMAGAGVFRWNGAGFDTVRAAPRSGPPRRTWVRPTTAPDGQLYMIKADSLFARHAGGAAAPWDTAVTVQSVGNNIYNLALEGPRLYVTTFSEGIGRLESGAWTRWLTPRTCFAPGCDADTTFYNPSFAFALLVDRRGIKWFGTWGAADDPVQPGAIERLDDSRSPASFTRYSLPIALGIPWNDGVPNPVRHTFAVASTVDSAGGHWFGMDSPERENPDFSAIGIDYYDPAGVFVRNFGVDGSGMNGPRSNRVLALATAKDGWVWVGTNLKGIQKVNPADTQHVFRTVELEQLDVRGLAPAGDTMWVMTTSEVRAYSREGVPALRLVKAPIPANPSDDAGHPLEIASDGTIWAGTTSGIQVFRRDGTKLVTYTVANSPLASNDVRAIVCDRARGAMWIGTSGGLNRFDLGYVAPPPPAIPSLNARIYPNPVRLTGLGIDLRLTGNATTYDGAIYDLHGRTLAVISGATNGGPVWNGRDLSGNLVGPGIYFLELRAGGHTGVERIVLLR